MGYKYNTDFRKEITGKNVDIVLNRVCPKCQTILIVLPPDRIWCTNTDCIYGEMHITGDGTKAVKTKQMSIAELDATICIEGEIVINLLTGKEYSFKKDEHTPDLHLPKRLVK